MGSDQDIDCIDCVLGKYIDVTGSDALSDCIDCIAGKYIDVTGSDHCIDCIAGKYIDVTGSDQQSDCIDCIAGKYINVPAATHCIVCSGGKYINVPAATHCIVCSGGKYTASQSASNGLHAVETGAIICNDCVLGKFNPEGDNACDTCPVGKYADAAGLPACLNCPRGTHVGSQGSDDRSDCIDCVKGKYMTYAAGSHLASHCISCPLGQYTHLEGAQIGTGQCIDCPNNMVTNTVGSDHQSFCQFCDPGSYVDTANGDTACMTCLSGRWSFGFGFLCYDCAAGASLQKTRAIDPCASNSDASSLLSSRPVLCQ
jgi:hypothetical protein